MEKTLEQKFNEHFPNGTINILNFIQSKHGQLCLAYSNFYDYYMNACTRGRINYDSKKQLKWIEHCNEVIGKRCFSYIIFGKRRHCYKFVSHEGKFNSAIIVANSYGVVLETDTSANEEETAEIIAEITNKLFEVKNVT